MDSGVFEEVAQQLKNNPQLARMLMEEQKKMEAQVSYHIFFDYYLNSNKDN